MLEPGDIFFTRGGGWLSRAIRVATRGPGEARSIVNHTGIISVGGTIRSAEAIEAAAVKFAEHAADTSDDKAWRDTGRDLRERIFAPIAKRLGKNVHTLCVCPDAALATVPLAALASATDGALLIDRFTIMSVSMAQDVVPWKEATATAPVRWNTWVSPPVRAWPPWCKRTVT